MNHEEQNETLFIHALNSLLKCLEIPLVLDSLLDLTPSLIIAIFESIFRARLPIPQEIRISVSNRARIDAMKIFLGTLEADVLAKLSSDADDVNVDAEMEGLHLRVMEIDPRRLADGELEEVVCIAEVLCWLGRRFKYITDGGDVFEEEEEEDIVDEGIESQFFEERGRVTSRPRHESSISTDLWGSPSTISSATANKHSLWSEDQDSSFSEAQTTIDAHSSYEFDPDATYDDNSSRLRSVPSVHGPSSCSHSIHELPFLDDDHVQRDVPIEESLSLCVCSTATDGDSTCNCSVQYDNPIQLPRPRRSGSLSSIDLEREISSFQQSQNATSGHHDRSPGTTGRPSASLLSFITPTRRPHQVIPRSVPKGNISSSQYTIRLLQERAFLLSELAKYKQGKVRDEGSY